MNIKFKKAICEISAGHVGAAWTDGGLAVLTLPEASRGKAEEKLDCELLPLSLKYNAAIYDSHDSGMLSAVQGEMELYFSGGCTALNLPVDWELMSPFRAKVLSVVKQIPWGKTLSYGRVAALLGNVRASRAVGGALGSNRVLLVIPCHRIIRGDGTLGGFGAGLEWKRRLLEIEGISLLR